MLYSPAIYESMSRQKKILPNRSVILVASAVAFSLFGDMAIYTVLPVTFESLGLTAIQVGLLLSVNRWIRLLTNHVAERALRKMRPVVLISAALLMGSALAAAYAFSPPFLVLLIVRVLWGLCWSFLRQIGVMTAANFAQKNDIGRIMGFYNAIVKLGFFGGTLLAGFFFDALGYRTMFFVLAAISLAGIPAAIGAFHSKIRSDAPPRPEHLELEVTSIPVVIKGFVFGTVGAGIIMSTLGRVLNEATGGSVTIGTIAIGVASLNGILLSSRHLLSIATSPLFGSFLDRFGIRSGERLYFTLATVALALCWFSGDVPVLLVSILVFFTCDVALNVALSADASSGGARRYAIFATGLDAGAAFGPLAAWTILEVIGGVKAGFALATVMYLIGAVVTWIPFAASKASKSD